jgi:multidrug efflux pump subunit AcrA (membrane-fusion protein)/YHS domain-containing protein
MKRNSAMIAGICVLLCVAFVAGRYSGRHRSELKSTSRRVLYYVDPMHPSYRSDKPGIAPDCGMALEPVYEGEAGPGQPPLQAGGIELSAERQQLIGIRTAVAQKSAGMRTIRTTGRIVPEDNRLYRIQAGFDGWVDSITDTPPGTVVKRDQVLATLYGPEVRSAELNYIGFIAGVERLRQGMAEGEARSLDDSKRVNEEQLRLLGMGEDEIHSLVTNHHAASNLNLVAPGDGIVLSRSISLRQRFEKGAELYRIADLSKVWIIADVHGSDGLFRPGTRVKVNVPELGKAVNATVTSAVPLFDEATRTLKVRLEADNPGLLLRPDMFVDVELEGGVPDGLSIPADAVLDSGLRKIVYVETRDGIFEQRPVEIAGVFGDHVVVADGISAGDRVVVSGNFLLDSESRMHATENPAIHSGKPILSPVAAAGTKDPVCGMNIKAGEIAVQETYKGKVFSFCSESCRKKFLADPEKYAGGKANVAAVAEDRAADRHD